MRRWKRKSNKILVKPERTLAEIELELEAASEKTREMERADPYRGMEDHAKSWDLYCKYMKPYWGAQRKLDRERRMLMTPEFNREVEKDDDVMSLTDFIEAVKDGCFIDYDGFGHYVKNGKMSDIDIYPSDVDHNSVRKDFDTIVWFNK